jgi:hypothetical protein
MKITRGQKSRATVPLMLILNNIVLKRGLYYVYIGKYPPKITVSADVIWGEKYEKGQEKNRKI